LGCCQAAAARTANEIKLVLRLDPERVELAGETFHEAWIDGLIGEGLPFDEHRPLADRAEVGEPDVGPFGARTNVDQLSGRLRGERLPGCLDINIVDSLIAVLLAQNDASPSN